MTMADRIAVMNEGRIEQAGSATELYEHPQTAFVAKFLGISNLIDGKHGAGGTFETHDGATLRCGPDAPEHDGGALQAGVRPEKITLLPASAQAPPGANVVRAEADARELPRDRHPVPRHHPGRRGAHRRATELRGRTGPRPGPGRPPGLEP